ncbi:MAG: potassium-transporting ATPase subunit A [Chlamydiae bacterium]|nr:potassium-transporting ATPase subunit A [Chlamydiota bacterium]
MINYKITTVLILISILILTSKYIGLHIFNILNYEKKPFLSYFIQPLEMFTYKILKIDHEKEHTWKDYLKNSLVLLFVGTVLVFCILLLQPYLPLNSNNFQSLQPSLALNIAISYCTNTDWQAYSPEKTISAFSQMTALTVQNFISASMGIAISAALVRGINRNSVSFLGNFWRDVIRVIYYLLLPLSIIAAVVLVSQGVPQTFNEFIKIDTIEGTTQTIYTGPIASQSAIKVLGTNGGGYTNTDSAHPFENPTSFSNFFQIIFMLLIPTAQIYFYGKSVNNLKILSTILTTLAVLFFLSVYRANQYEERHPPLVTFLNLETTQGNMEGKEVRFGPLGSCLYTVTSNLSSNGSTNSTIDSYMPGGTFIATASILVGETLLGGCGTGIFSMMTISILSMYLIGLMSGKDPEYHGKKIDVFHIKMSISTLLIFITLSLGLTSIAVLSDWGISAKLNSGPRGFTEILYTFLSTTANNGSAMLTNSVNTPMYNMTTALAMLLHRVVIIILACVLSGHLSSKVASPITNKKLQISGITFSLLLLTLIFILCGISFTPALFLGPLLEGNELNIGILF